MLNERERNRIERWGMIEPIEPPLFDDPPLMHPDEFPPLPAQEADDWRSRLALRAMVAVLVQPRLPLCAKCRRPYDPASRILRERQAEPWYRGGCQHCSPLGPRDWGPIYLSGPNRRTEEDYGVRVDTGTPEG